MGKDRNCIFCKIVKDKVEVVKIWENDKFVVIFDSSPNTKGMTLILTKKHYNSYAFNIPNEVYSKLMLITKKVARMLEKGLGVARVAMVMEGMGINHVHIKLYPLHGITRKFKEVWARERIYFEKYEGYISTQLGPQANKEELKKLAEKIRRRNKIK